MKGILITLFLFAFALILANIKTVSAQAPSAGDFSSWIQTTLPSSDLRGADGNITIGSIISALLPYIFGIAGFLILIYIVLGGYQVLISQGDPKLIAAGQEKITYAIVGFIVMFSAFWIVQLAGRILNIEQITDIFG